MVTVQTVGSIFIKVLKLVLNLICLILYRTGYGGGFLGVGGTWNLNEDKNPDAEIVASGIMVGFFIYTLVSVIGMCVGSDDHKTSFTDIIMNFIGMFMWVAVGATALHYWHGYQSENRYKHIASEKQIGLALGSLCVMSGAAYLLDLVLAGIHFAKNKM